MPRRNINASERTEKRWSSEYIKKLMRELRQGRFEKEYDTPIIQPNKDIKRKYNTKKKDKISYEH